jgi:hypothetical protein
MTKRKNEGALATMAYVRGWRQNNDGRWFKTGVAGTFNSASDAFKAEEKTQAKWLRLNSAEEFLQFQRGRISRSPFPLGGFIYTTWTTPDDGKMLYSGNSLADARAAVPRGKD